MHILFPADPLSPRQIEVDFQLQAEAAQVAGFRVLRVDHDALIRGDSERALRFIEAVEEPQIIIYRGWMLREGAYAKLYDGLICRNFQLLNAPTAYANCHQLPGWYEVLKDVTPHSVWVEKVEDERTIETLPWARIWEALASFGDTPLVLKDYVKSRKHEWHEACFIPSASDRKAVERVTRYFTEGQAENLVGGLVYREWLKFQSMGVDEGGMPSIQEARCWLVDGEPFFVISQTGAALESHAPREWVKNLSSRVIAQLGSRFFTMDVAQLPDGTWRVIELGDGQVSGLPPVADAPQFYAALHARLTD